MPKGTRLTVDTADKAIELLERDVSRSTIADVLGVSEHTLIRISNALKAAKDGNIELARKADLTQDVMAHILLKYGGIDIKAQTAQAEAPAKTADDNTAAAVVKLLCAITEMSEAVKAMTAAINQIDNRLSAMQMTQAGLRGDFGKEAQRVIEAIHVEGDIISKDQQKMIEHLDKIGHNTKKRPWQGEGAAS